MIIPIISFSALEFWLGGVDESDYLNQYHPLSLPRHFDFSITRQLACELIREYHLSAPVHLMVPTNNNRRSNETFHLHSYPKHLPPNSFMELTSHLGEVLLVSSPEACFLYAASTLPFYEVVRIGCMLCAMYVSDKSQALLQRSRSPITNVRKIQQYLQKADNVPGIKKARRAIRYVVDNCNSPMEVSLAVLACLPIAQGGYGLERPIMNGELHLSSTAASKINIRQCRCDMVWEERKTVLEYDSNLTHLEKNQHEYDKKRISAINISGYRIITLTAGQLSSFGKAEEVFSLLRNMLGMDPRKKRLKQYEDLRWEVVHEILLKKKTLQQILGIGMQGNS